MSEKKWYTTGKEGEAKAKEVEKMQGGGGNRFWIPAEKSAKMTFLDGEGFYMWEHNLKLRGKWNNFYTCLQDFSNCPLCDSGDKASHVCVFSIIDHTPYESKKYKRIVKNQKKLLVIKPKALAKLKLKRDKKADGDLTLAAFEVTRTDADAPNTGDDFEFLGRLTKEKLAKLIPAELSAEERKVWLDPFDYVTLFEPKNASILEKLVGLAVSVGGGDDKVTDPDDEDVPGSITGDDNLEDLL